MYLIELNPFRHQKKALAMMAEKEFGVLEGASFGTLWDCTTDENGRPKYEMFWHFPHTATQMLIAVH